MHEDDTTLNQISDRIIGCAFSALNTLECGFLEKVYENALAHELRKAGLSVAQRHPITVWYNNIIVGKHVADMLVEATMVVELKAVETLDNAQNTQCISDLKASGLRLCLLLNFGKPRVEIHRVANGV
jgi:GxxExxY protein